MIRFILAFVVLIVVIGPALALSGCAPSSGARSPERATARAAVLTLAEAVHVADGACATVARERHDPKIARTCADGYDAARPALLAAEAGIDAWDSGAKQRALCAAADAVRALRGVGDAIIAAGGKLPAIVEDALRLTSTFGGLCHG